MYKRRRYTLNPILKEAIYSDLYRYTGNRSFKLYLKFYNNPGFKYMSILRKCKFYKSRKLYQLHYFFNKIKLRKLMYKYGYEIPSSTNIGDGFYIGHFGGIAINPEANIGKNVSISKGVTIGHANRGKHKGVPTIGNLVWIGTNAIIVGKVTIGNNVLIAPNAYVNFDVPDNSVVVGNPGKIIANEKATEGYIVYPV